MREFQILTHNYTPLIILSQVPAYTNVHRGGADSDILMKPNSECSEKPVLPCFTQFFGGKSGIKTRKSGFTLISVEKRVFETENPVFRVPQKHGSHP